MDDSKRGLNLVGTSVANIKNDLLGLANVLEHQVLPKINQMSSSLQKVSLLGPSGKPISGSNSIANSGAPSAPTDNSGSGAGGGGFIANSGIGGGGGRAATAGLGFMAAGNYVSNLMPNVRTAIQQDLLTSQSAFYGQGGYGGSLVQQAGNVRAMQNRLARMGTAISAMDTTQALAQAQAFGLSGASNFNKVMEGVAVASNFTPGSGIGGPTGTINVAAAMQSPGSVNMLKTVGINVRGPNGEMMSPPQVVEKLWQLITQNGKVPLSEQDIQTGLIPGNGLYGMLNSLYGSDQLTITTISNMLIAKARSGGKLNLSTADRSDLQRLGLSTATVNKIARQTAGQTKLLTGVASAEAAGYGLSADLGNALNNFAAAAGPLTQALGALSGGYTGTMGLNNGLMGSTVKTGLGFAAGQGIAAAAKTILPKLLMAIPFLAEGGPAEGKQPYIVGEKGPELFVPKTDGVVVPNHMLGSPNREGGGAVTAGGWAKDLLVALGAPVTAQNVSNISMWEGREGGHWHNTAKYNPLNTSYQMSGSANFNTGVAGSGVQAYTSWEQGLAATVGTLTGANAKSRGYTAIVNALKKGNVSKDQFFKLMQASAWDAGHYGGKGGASSSAGSSNSSLSSVASSADYSMQIQNLLASSANAIGLGSTSSGGGGVTYNNGPLTINISGSSDPKKVAAEVQKILVANHMVAQTGAN